MLALNLFIQLESPLLLGSGSAFSSLIDQDLEYDELGIPFFPARRLKGLLRESAEEIIEILHLSGVEEYVKKSVEEIFGSADTPSKLIFHDLYLSDYDDKTRSTLRKLNRAHSSIINQVNILGTFTEIRQQTAIENGIYKEHSLRTLRVLNHKDQNGNKRCFEGRVLAENDEDVLRLLVLASLNLRYAGSLRNRGLGHINCTIGKAGEKDNNSLTDRVLKELKNPSLPEADRLSSNPLDEKGNNEDSKTCGKELYLKITALSPLLFTKSDSDQNMVKSLDYIPGGSLLGFFAQKYIKAMGLKKDEAHLDETFRQWFLEGDIIFNNAYPLIVEDDKIHYAEAMPLSIHKDKMENKIYNLINKNPGDAPTKALGGWTHYKNFSYSVQKTRNLHLRKNTDYGRFTGHTAIDGDLFNYEAIATGEEFWTKISIKENNEVAKEFYSFFNSLKNEGEVKIYAHLGRSLNTGYGLVSIEIVSESKGKEPLWGEPYTVEVSEGESEESNNNEFILLFTSPVILYNEMGFSEPSVDVLNTYLDSYLPGRLQVLNQYPLEANEKSNEVEKFPGYYFTRREHRDKFTSHWKLPAAANRVFSMGSVFRLELKDGLDKNAKDAFKKIIDEGIGEFRQEGYGQVQIFVEMCGEKDYNNHDNQVSNKKVDYAYCQDNEFIIGIIKSIIEDYYYKELANKASSKAENFHKGKTKESLLSSSLIGRLEGFLDNSKNQDEFIKKLAEIVEDTRKILGAYKHKGESLLGLLENKTHIEGIENKTINDIIGKLEMDFKFNSMKYYRHYWSIFFQRARKLNKELMRKTANESTSTNVGGGGNNG